ncbi:MAG: S1 RNA-binding domain-containing protein [Pseudomonadota bacterium]
MNERIPVGDVGQVLWLPVVAVNNTGAFLDWGRPKDLLLPFGEQEGRVAPGEHCLVFVALDDEDRPFASMKLNDFIFDTFDEGDGDNYPQGKRVELVIAGETDLGIKAVVDHRYWGLIHREDLFRPLRRGQTLAGYMKRPRDDGKLDVTVNPPAHVAADALTDRILAALQQRGGFLPLSDKSAPEDIQRTFGVSKGVFKQAIGALYKQRRILIAKDGIRLAGNDSPR